MFLKFGFGLQAGRNIGSEARDRVRLRSQFLNLKTKKKILS